MLKASIPSSVKMTIDIDGDVKTVFADATKVHEILLNLGTNAVQSMDEKGELVVSLYDKEIKITEQGVIDLIRPNIYSIIEVTDSGVGIESDILPNIFEPYYTTKEVGRGTGLGLSVIYGIMQSHNGDIQVETVKGEGTTFKLFFPKSAEDAIPEETGTTETLMGSERVLFVDDEPMVMEMGKDLLASLGYEVTSTIDSEEALQLFKNNPSGFDLLITDQTMPVLTGVELAKEILKIDKNFPIILCTGYSSKVDDEKAKAIGVKSFLMKPLKKDELAKVIREVLD